MKVMRIDDQSGRLVAMSDSDVGIGVVAVHGRVLFGGARRREHQYICLSWAGIYGGTLGR